jgi:hypothetical protein
VNIVLTAESGAAFDELTRTNAMILLSGRIRLWPNISARAVYPGRGVINANRYRAELCQKVQQFMKQYDVVIAPTFAGNQLSITNLRETRWCVCLSVLKT